MILRKPLSLLLFRQNAEAEKQTSRRHIKPIIMETAFFLAMGWCGTKYPGWWRQFLKKPPIPEPEPWWIISTIGLGLIAGLAGGTIFSIVARESQYFAGQTAIASGLFAFGTANIVTGIASAFKD